ncbi:MAG: hypothetical protein L0Z55_12550 [Planctomycetes bacterium]|nr:hypothetical protein [Planctomycetota bacterium]
MRNCKLPWRFGLDCSRASGLLLAALFGLGCIPFASGPRAWERKEATLRIAAPELRQIRCRTHNGDIASVGKPAPTEVLVLVSIRAGGASAEDAREALAAIEVISDTGAGETLELGWRWREEPRETWHAEVAFAIEQPESIPIVAETHNGAVRLDALAGDAAAESHNGALTFTNCSGSARAKSHNGNIALDGDFRVVEAITHNGGIKSRITTEGRLDGSLTTHNGSVELESAAGTCVKALCRTANGSIVARPPWETVAREEDSLEAHLGSGEGTLTLATHNGSVSLAVGAK